MAKAFTRTSRGLVVRTLGWKKDKRDERDFLHVRVMAPPDVVILSAFLPDVREQGRLGACTGFGIGGNLSASAKQLAAYTEWFSPTWIYNGGRLVGGTLGEDSGCYPRDNFEFIRKYGCLLEHFKPYRDVLDTTDPTTWTSAPEALKHPILTYVRVTDGTPYICSALAEGHLVSLGAPWFQAWMSVGSNGLLPEDYREKVGGHETFLYGYDLRKGVFYGQNSWGEGWGANGRFVMPMSAISEFKVQGGYDAHYVTVAWAAQPEKPGCLPRWLGRLLSRRTP